MKILTVVVPTYNSERYLERCLISLFYNREILDDLEVIIVNDGSKDGSLRIAKDYQSKFPSTITIIDKENGGHGSTINAALKIAKGKYFRIVDSDDWVNIIDFPKLLGDLGKYDVDLVLTNYRRELVYEGSSIEFEYNDEIIYDKVYQLSDFGLQLLGDEYFFLATSTFRTEMLRTANFNLDEKTYYVDMEMIVFPIREISNFVYLDYSVYRYYIGRYDQSISVQGMARNRSDHEKVVRRLLDFYAKAKLPKNKREYVKRILVLMLNTHYMIYCGIRAQDRHMVREIRSFDKSLRETQPNLYSSVAKKFPYLYYYRRSKFRYIRYLSEIYRTYLNRQLRIKNERTM